MKKHFLFSCLLVSGMLGSTVAVHATTQENSSERAPGQPLHSESYAVNSQFYLPPPPKQGDAAFENDNAAYLNGYKMKGSPRWQQAAQDADLHVGNIANIFSPVVGVKIDEKQTPATWKMLEDLRVVGDYAANDAKKYYMRTRPFVVYKHHTCLPASEDALRKNGSYPSGHTTFGTLAALVLSEAKPDRAQELMKRGYEFGQSRVICGAHWQSDVDAGRFVGATEFARLQTLPVFIQTLQQVKRELNPER